MEPFTPLETGLQNVLTVREKTLHRKIQKRKEKLVFLAPISCLVGAISPTREMERSCQFLRKVKNEFAFDGLENGNFTTNVWSKEYNGYFIFYRAIITGDFGAKKLS